MQMPDGRKLSDDISSDVYKEDSSVLSVCLRPVQLWRNTPQASLKKNKKLLKRSVYATKHKTKPWSCRRNFTGHCKTKNKKKATFAAKPWSWGRAFIGRCQWILPLLLLLLIKKYHILLLSFGYYLQFSKTPEATKCSELQFKKACKENKILNRICRFWSFFYLNIPLFILNVLICP